MIAGHTFIDTPHGRVCDCGRAWVQIASTTEADIGQLGIAHVGALLPAEVAEIDAERQRIWACVGDVSRGGR